MIIQIWWWWKEIGSKASIKNEYFYIESEYHKINLSKLYFCSDPKKIYCNLFNVFQTMFEIFKFIYYPSQFGYKKSVYSWYLNYIGHLSLPKETKNEEFFLFYFYL